MAISVLKGMNSAHQCIDEPGLVLIRDSGWPIDHIGLGAAKLEDGIAWLAKRTGVNARIVPLETGQWYRSAALPLGLDSSIEVLAPNPSHRGPNPMKAVLSRCQTPQLLFWYVAVREFDTFAQAAQRAGARIEGVQRIDPVDGQGAAYDRGWLGPGFLSQRPCVIQWRRREHLDRQEAEPTCSLLNFKVSHPDGERLSRLLTQLAIPVTVETGAPAIALTIDTPRGPITLEDTGIDFSGLAGLCGMLLMTFRSML